MFLIDIMKHIQTLNFALQGILKDKIRSSQTVFSFHIKIKVFQKDINSKIFCHFSNLRTKVNVISEVMTEHKVEEYKDKLQGLGRSSNPDLVFFRSLSHALRSL